LYGYPSSQSKSDARDENKGFQTPKTAVDPGDH
jgi:hypothetical protein